MNLKSVLLLPLFVFFVFSCNDNQYQQKPTNQQQIPKNIQTNKNIDNSKPTKPNINTTEQTAGQAEIVNYTPQLPYELKDDGLYVYLDGPYKREKVDKYCYKYILKNYKYIRVPSRKDKIISVEGPKKWQNCNVMVTCEDDLGKPTLKELGYERHKEREIKPEDNRFGVDKKIQKSKKVIEKRLYEETNYNYILDKYFTQITKKEFVNNGIVIIGKHISRVVVKSLEHLPKYGDKILVEYDRTIYKCNGDIKQEYVLKPEVIADFKRINFKENIFEFIKEKPLPKDADYLSDAEFVRLCENIHQFIPRTVDNTIHKKHNYRSGYYIIEYYNGDVLYDYQCIKLGRPGRKTPLWNALQFDSPTSEIFEAPEQKYALILAECNSMAEAENFLKQKDSYPVVILPFNNNGKVLVGKMFYNKSSAKTEMQRYLNMGVKKESMKILPFD